MTVQPLSRKEFLSALQKQMLPRVTNNSALLIPAHPSLAASTTQVTPRKTPLLRPLRHGRSYVSAGSWVEEGLNAVRYPTLIWVAEGEADFRIGVTRRMAAHDKKLSSKFGCYVVTLPANSFFLVPPGTPISDASQPHWERPHLEKARSRLLWLHVMPAGVSLHLCTTVGATHTPSRPFFLNETRLFSLAEALLEESQNPNIHSEALTRQYLLAFLLHLDRTLSSTRVPLEEEAATPPQQHTIRTESTPTQRACRFIEANLSQKLLVSQISSHAYISPTQLNRLFRAELNVSIGEYITQRRMEQARALLQTTDLPVGRIGVLCGYPKPEHFSRAFLQHNAISPGNFRHRART